MLQTLQWRYERDECWGPDGEPLLSAMLDGEDLALRLRNSRRFGLEAVLATRSGDDFDTESDGPSFKAAFDDGSLQPLPARVQSSAHLAFVEDVRAMVGQLNCGNRIRLHARKARGGVWWQLDAHTDDLHLARLVEPASGITLSYRRAEHAPAAPAAPAAQAARRRHAPAAAAQTPNTANELLNAVAPLAAMVGGYHLGKKLFGPSKRD